MLKAYKFIDVLAQCINTPKRGYLLIVEGMDIEQALAEKFGVETIKNTRDMCKRQAMISGGNAQTLRQYHIEEVPYKSVPISELTIGEWEILDKTKPYRTLGTGAVEHALQQPSPFSQDPRVSPFSQFG
jgi:hypothetical protein